MKLSRLFLASLLLVQTSFLNSQGLAIAEMPPTPAPVVSISDPLDSMPVLTMRNSAPREEGEEEAFYPTSIQTSKVENLTLEQSEQLLSQISAGPRTEMVMITDDDNLARQVIHVQADAEKKGKKKFDILLHLDNVKNNVKSRVVESHSQDRFGFWFTAVSFGLDSYFWITGSQMDTLQKVAILSFNLLLTASFGIHKDLWAKTTKPIESKIKTLFNWIKAQKKIDDKTSLEGQADVMPGLGSSTLSDVSIKLASSFLLSTTIQLTRLAIYNGSDLFDATKLPWLLISTVAVSSVLAFSQFAWDEQIATVDNQVHGNAKFALRRLKELRGVMMSFLAPTSKLVQFDSFGYMPWLISITHGVFGILLFLNSDRVVTLLERLKPVSWFRSSDGELQVQVPLPEAMSCESVLSYF